jgi:hypothetical protein
MEIFQSCLNYPKVLSTRMSEEEIIFYQNREAAWNFGQKMIDRIERYKVKSDRENYIVYRGIILTDEEHQKILQEFKRLFRYTCGLEVEEIKKNLEGILFPKNSE